MHSDTNFDIISDKYFIVLNITKREEPYHKKVYRKAFLYEENGNNPIMNLKKVNGSNIFAIPKTVGNYKLISVYQKFYDFLTDNGFEII